MGPQACEMINSSICLFNHKHLIKPGIAAGCEYLRPEPQPYTVGQNLTPDMRSQASKLFIFDMLAQNVDRHESNHNMGLVKGSIFAYDFEMCFSHLFIPLIGVNKTVPQLPSQTNLAHSHLFRDVFVKAKLSVEVVEEMAKSLNETQWVELRDQIPTEWHTIADKIGEFILSISSHAHEFAFDVLGSTV